MGSGFGGEEEVVVHDRSMEVSDPFGLEWLTVLDYSVTKSLDVMERPVTQVHERHGEPFDRFKPPPVMLLDRVFLPVSLGPNECFTFWH